MLKPNFNLFGGNMRLIHGALALSISLAGLGTAVYADEAVKGSIPASKDQMLDFPFMAKVGIQKAIAAARKAVPEGIPAYAYQLADSGSLTWTIWMSLKDKSQKQVDVDAGTGEVLSVKDVTKDDKKDDSKDKEGEK
jgi:hypothetical protein